MFLGPTGTGKTRAVEATAEGLVGQGKILKVDCAEFQHSHEIAKLVGSPPGYLGHRETHALLSQEALNSCHSASVKISFVLFDEIEKASDALWNLLLGILDKAVLTTGDNRRVNFSQTMIFMTSNLGAAGVQSILQPKLGFQTRQIGCEEARTGGVSDRIVKTSVEAARRKFTPEFWNRLDKVVVFRPLAQSQLRRILDLELSFVQQRILQAGGGDRSFGFSVSDAAKNMLLDQGTAAEYGARHLKRAIERLLVQPLSNLISSQQVRAGDWLTVDVGAAGGPLRFQREQENIPLNSLAQALQEGATSWTQVPKMAAAAARGQIQRLSRRI